MGKSHFGRFESSVSLDSYVFLFPIIGLRDRRLWLCLLAVISSGIVDWFLFEHNPHLVRLV